MRFHAAVNPVIVVVIALLSGSGRGDEPRRVDPFGDPLPYGARLRLGTVLADGPARRAQAHGFTRDGLLISSAGDLSVIDLRTMKEVRRLKDKYAPITAGAAKTMGLKSQGGGTTVWDLDDESPVGAPLRRFSGHRPLISPDRKWVVDIDSGLGVYDLATGKPRFRDMGARGGYVATISADSRYVAMLDDNPDNAEITIHDLTDGKRISHIRINEGDHSPLSGSTLAFSPDGKILAAGTWRSGTWFFATKSGRILRHAPFTAARLAYSPDGRFLANADQSGTVQLRETVSGAELRRFPGHEVGDVPGPRGVNFLAFGPDGHSLVTSGSDGTTVVWELGAPDAWDREIRKADVTDEELRVLWDRLAEKDAVRAAQAWWTLAALGDRATAWVRQHVPSPPKVVPDRVQMLLKNLHSDTFTVRQTATTELQSLGPDAEDALRQALKERPPLEVRRRIEGVLTRFEEQEVGQDFTGPQMREVRAVAMLAQIGSDESRGLLEELARSSPRLPLSRAARASLLHLKAKTPPMPWVAGAANPVVFRDPTLVREAARWNIHRREISSLAFSPDGKLLAWFAGHTISVRHVATGKEYASIDGADATYTLSFSPDGTKLAWGEGKSVALWDVLKKQHLPALAAHNDYVLVIAFSPDGKLLASGSNDATVRIWDLNTAGVRHVLKGHEEYVTALAFSPDGAKLFSGGETTNVLFPNCPICETDRLRVWDVTSGRLIRRLTGRGNAVAFGPDGRTIAGSGHIATYDKGDGPAAIAMDGVLINGRRRTHVWDSVTGSKIHEYDRGGSIAFAVDARTFALAPGTNRGLTSKRRGNHIHEGRHDSDPELRDIATGKEIARLAEPAATVLAFSPDGKHLAVGTTGGAVALYDLAAGAKALLARPHDFGPLEIERSWNDLTGDPMAAFLAHQALAQLGPETVRFLRSQLKPARILDAKRVAELLDYLEDDQPAVRELAAQELETWEEAVLPHVDAALKEQHSEPLRRPLLALRERLTKSAAAPERQRALRAVHLLEQIGSADSRELLRTLAQGEPSASLTVAAQNALLRLKGRGA
jgi:WD40 repeat protein